MNALEVVAVLASGVAAGTINVVVGSGTLVTFPVLLAVGYSPIVANVSNSLGLVPGAVAGAIGYRRELAGQRARAFRYGAASFTGAIAGAVLLLTLPAEAFRAIVPVFIALAIAAILLQPRLQKRLAERRDAPREHGPVPTLVVLGTGVYGGYFGAGQGILLLGILGLTLPDDLQRVNALKNVLAALVNLVAGIVFIFIADVAWLPVLLLALGATAGGILGARYGRRLPPAALRAVIVVVGVAAIVQLVAN